MSPRVQSFFEKISEDADLRHQVESIQQPSVEAATEAIAALAREYGFALTAKDFLPRDGEISGDDLADIVGGAAGDTGFMGGGRGPLWRWTEKEDGYLKWEKVQK